MEDYRSVITTLSGPGQVWLLNMCLAVHRTPSPKGVLPVNQISRPGTVKLPLHIHKESVFPSAYLVSPVLPAHARFTRNISYNFLLPNFRLIALDRQGTTTKTKVYPDVEKAVIVAEK